MNKYLFLSVLFLSLHLLACGNNNNNTSEKQPTASKLEKESQEIATKDNTFRKGPNFPTQQAYQWIQKQVDFGPRVPGTQEHKDCADWIYGNLANYVDEIIMQNIEVQVGDGSMKPCYNIFGQINPEASERILFLAHWDTRPWADQDDPKSQDPILGADDGASGVGVLLAFAKVIKENKVFNKKLGIDILFVDVEDYGKTEWGNDSYAIGARKWAEDAKNKGYSATMGILLDMVGAKDARFAMEGYSRQYAAHVIQKVWGIAHASGYGNYFVYKNGYPITDDHVQINKILNIPTIDIINLPENSKTAFVDHWHTQRDNMEIINQNTLEAVGQTLVNFIYNY